MRYSLLFFVFSFLGISCAVQLPYVSDYPLTPEIFHTRDGVITGRVPQGWFCSTDDTLAPALTAWLIKDDFTAVLSFRELNLDPATRKNVEHEGLSLLASISLGMNGGDATVKNNKLQEFSYGDKKYSGYELGAGSRCKRIVVFSAGGKYYECEARAANGNWAPPEIKRLFTIQQSVLAALRF